MSPSTILRKSQTRAVFLISAATALVPSLLSAHPGHYHGETDEFDFIRATFLHSHGALDYVLAGVALASIAVVCLHGRPPVRISAMILAAASLALIPVL
jgi:hypothetical protein